MKKKKNVLREKLNSGQPTLGTHTLVSWPGLIEVIGNSGVIDYVEFVGEYAPIDLYEMENYCRAVELFDHMSAMLKVDQEPKLYLAVRSIGSGFQNLLFADVRTVEDAEDCVKATRADTPRTKGLAGAGMRRDVGYVLAPGSETYVEQLEDAVVAIMIEKKCAVEKLDDILSVPGIDMVQFGPADYAMSLGHPGQFKHPEVQEAEKFTIQTALKKGIAPRVELHDIRDAEPYLEQGVKHFCVGWDVTVMYRFCQDQGEQFAKIMGK